ncbi:hypothetical protein A2159_01995 [Candidatus Woesebacteria bacterium RBG_13_34_9]|uniref:Uncharacterized protein n=1 Tax=Candidatus Woesebacteria bacterium RBG_13_34_9 TaxID=1802477 RepID=A0A1F7X1X0_9BACT|nr:MAG: hypothetical protein A2159_01995 [Candidatus Woesebacteria bacterium RBG_13_34_9]
MSNRIIHLHKCKIYDKFNVILLMIPAIIFILFLFLILIQSGFRQEVLGAKSEININSQTIDKR